MSLMHKLQASIDYLIGAFMVLSSLYELRSLIRVIGEVGTDIGWDTMVIVIPYLVLFFSGIFIILLPGKNLRRTIWLSSLVLAVNFILLGVSEAHMYKLYRSEGVGMIYSMIVYTMALVYFGCGIAMMVNSVLFALRRLKSVYVILISLLLVFSVEYLSLELEIYQFSAYSEYLYSTLGIFIPHMLLLLVYMFVFVSDEISWYTAKGGMKRAMDRLHTIGSIFAIRTLTRDQLIVLMSSEYDITLQLEEGENSCKMDVLQGEDCKTLVFRRSMDDTQANALYLDIVSIVPQGTVGDCRYVDMYGMNGECIRMNVIETRVVPSGVFKVRKILDKGYVPNGRLSLPNLSLYSLVDGVGRFELEGPVFSKKKCELEIVEADNHRIANVYLDGVMATSMRLVAVVPVCEYGAYTKLYLYGDTGRALMFKVRDPASDIWGPLAPKGA